VSAAGINYGCSSSTRTIDLSDDKSVNSTLFSMAFDMNYDDGLPILLMTSEFVSSINENCLAAITTETCNIIPATNWYPVTIQGSTIAMDMQNGLNSIAIGSNYTSSGDARSDDQSAPLGPLKGLYVSAHLFPNSKILLRISVSYWDVRANHQ
jgi:hypothetical protein